MKRTCLKIFSKLFFRLCDFRRWYWGEVCDVNVPRRRTFRPRPPPLSRVPPKIDYNRCGRRSRRCSVFGPPSENILNILKISWIPFDGNASRLLFNKKFISFILSGLSIQESIFFFVIHSLTFTRIFNTAQRPNGENRIFFNSCLQRKPKKIKIPFPYNYWNWTYDRLYIVQLKTKNK